MVATALHEVRAEVAALVESGLSGFDHATAVSEVCGRLGLTDRPGTLLTGQVKRALNEQVEAGRLVKARRGSPLAGSVSPRYYSADGYRAAEVQCLAEATERARPLRDRAARVGVPLGDPTLTPDADRLVVPVAVDAAERLVDLATAAADYSASCWGVDVVARHAAAGQLEAVAQRTFAYVDPEAARRPEDTTPGFPSVERARGLVLGLLLGDALAHRPSPDDAWLTGSAAGQLACSSLEGLIRAHVRGAERGIVDVCGMVWMAYTRWGHGQGLPVDAASASGLPWPDGWLAQQSPLRERRGKAPATVTALTRAGRGTPESPTTGSAGYHAVTSSVPVALFPPDVRDSARRIAALTHGDRGAQRVAGEFAALLAEALHGVHGVSALPAHALLTVDGATGTAQHAVRHGVAAALAHPLREQFLDALAVAHRSGGRGAAACAGALLGASHGVDALPGDLLGRLELGLVGDTLARDAVTQQREVPAGDAYWSNPDRTWWLRYPGC